MIETINRFLVAGQGQQVLVMRPPLGPITKDDALILAAWLVAIAEDGEHKFQPVLDAVLDT